MPNYLPFDPSSLQSASVVYVSNDEYMLTQHLLIADKDDLTIIFEPGFRFNDPGQIVTSAQDGSQFRLPYGVEFRNCARLKIRGVQIYSSYSGGGSTEGHIGPSNFDKRVPGFWLNGSVDHDVEFDKIDFNPGRGVSLKLTDILTALYPGGWGPNENNQVVQRGYSVHSSNSPGGRISFKGFGAKTDREQIGFSNCPDMRLEGRNRHPTPGWTSGSWYKVLGCDRGTIGPLSGVWNNVASLGDASGFDLLFDRLCVQLPPLARMIDVTNEHSGGNIESDRVTIRDCSAPDGAYLLVTVSSAMASTHKRIGEIRVENSYGWSNPSLAERIVRRGFGWKNRANLEVATTNQHMEFIGETYTLDAPFADAAGTSLRNGQMRLSKTLKFRGCKFVVTESARSPLTGSQVAAYFNFRVAGAQATNEASVDRHILLEDCEFIAPSGTPWLFSANIRLLNTPIPVGYVKTTSTFPANGTNYIRDYSNGSPTTIA